jgi:hypothetical protein
VVKLLEKLILRGCENRKGLKAELGGAPPLPLLPPEPFNVEDEDDTATATTDSFKLPDTTSGEGGCVELLVHCVVVGWGGNPGLFGDNACADTCITLFVAASSASTPRGA